MNYKKTAALVGAAVGVGAAMAPATPVSAARDFGWTGNIDTQHGGGARCHTWQTDIQGLANFNGHIECYLYDTWDDGDAIYVAWNIMAYANEYMFADLNLHNGESQYRYDNASGDSSISEQRWQVCKDVTFNDPCAHVVLNTK